MKFSFPPFVSSAVETRCAAVLDYARTERKRIASALALGALVSAPALAQSVVTSAAPLSASVTVYRDMGRGEGGMNPGWVNGYALISEKRRIALPAGESLVRFEGVADGMIAVSAVVSGLPGGVIEKNRDAKLLSPASLLDGSLGNRVHIRRTNPATGKVTETDAIIRSGADGAVVLQTAEGVEALRCSGLPETLVYDAVPDGLSARPTFSVETSSAEGATVDVTLTYLATGFDWNAAYVATVAEDGKTLDLSAWLTVANGNDTDYACAQLLAVAGKPNQTSDFRALGDPPQAPQLNLQCWPMDSTSTHPGMALPTSPAPPAAPMIYEVSMSAQSAARLDKAGNIVAQQEDLGDLKLYRVPVPVDVLPNGQKQVRLLAKQRIPFTRIYTATVSPWESRPSQPLDMKLRMQNKTKEGLGLPLPSGGVIVMQNQGEAEVLLADSNLADKAVGEKLELDAGQSDQVRLEQQELGETGKLRRFRITLTNALDRAAPVEITIARADGYEIVKSSAKLKAKGADRLWTLTLAANGKASLDYSLKEN